MKRTRDEALEHVKTTLREGGNPLMKQEVSFIRTSCHILGIDSGNTIKAIVKGAKEKGKKQPRKVLEHLQSQLRELAERVEKHKWPTPNPAASTRAVDAMGAPARSLGHLLSCAEALREAIKGQYSKGIKVAVKAMENAKLDFKTTIDRIAEANKWKEEMIEDWTNRGEQACANLIEKAEEALKEAEVREEAEAKVRIMEGQCEELAGLAAQAGKQVPAEAEVEVLEELEEEIDQRKERLGPSLEGDHTGRTQGPDGGGHEGVSRDGDKGKAVRGPRENPPRLRQQGLGVEQLQGCRGGSPRRMADRGGGARGSVWGGR